MRESAMRQPVIITSPKLDSVHCWFQTKTRNSSCKETEETTKPCDVDVNSRLRESATLRRRATVRVSPTSATISIQCDCSNRLPSIQFLKLAAKVLEQTLAVILRRQRKAPLRTLHCAGTIAVPQESG